MSATPQASRPILIAGGGIGGLAAAIALANAGFRCRVLELRASPDEAGAGIQLGPNGTKALRALGIDTALAERAGRPEAIVVRDGLRGRVQARLPLGPEIADRFGAPYWTAHRADLHAALSEVAARHPGIVLTHGFTAGRLEATEGGVKIISDAGGEATGGALIGADGLWSKIRSYVAGSRQPRFTGRRAYRAVIPAASAAPVLTGNVVGLWLLRRCHVVHYPVRGGTEIALVVVLHETAPRETWSEPADRDQLLDRLRKLLDPERVDALAGAERWNAWDLFELPQLPAWSNGRVVLMGDAAHPMQPFLAQGAVMALEDALTLAPFMAATPGDLPTAFLNFEKARKARVTRVTRTAAANGRIYHAAGPIRLARNGIMKALPGQRLMARYDWLYGWSPP